MKVRRSYSVVCTSKDGFTLVEMLITISICLVLLGLLVMAVQSARESARRVQCQDRLRQTVLGLLQVVERQKGIPSMVSTKVADSVPNRDPVYCNPLVAVATELNLQFRVRNGVLRFDDIDDQDDQKEAFPPPFFSCPSNSDRWLAFRLNSGVDPILTIRTLDKYIFAQKKKNSLALVEDGLSNTAALAERPASQKRSNRYRAIALDDTSNSFAEMRNNCRLAFDNNQIYYPPFPGNWWTNSHYQVRYDHSFQPNSREIDCVNASSPGNLIDVETRFWISSRSFHRGGVNVAFFDGSTRFTKDSIDLSAWRSLGTHNKHDTSIE